MPEVGGFRVRDAMVTVQKTHGMAATVDAMREFFTDGHVHMALVVDDSGVLATTVERADLDDHLPGTTRALRVGTLRGRTVRATDPLAPVTDRLRREGRRRLAVVDDAGRLVGLLCFKRSGTGYCSDDGIRARAAERRSAPFPP